MSEKAGAKPDYKERLKGLSKDELITLAQTQSKKIKQMSGYKKIAAQYLKKTKALEAQLNQQNATKDEGKEDDDASNGKGGQGSDDAAAAAAAKLQSVLKDKEKEMELLKASHPRYNWSDGDKVEVCVSPNKWTVATIVKTHHDQQGDWVVWRTSSGESKQAQRLDTQLVRPINYKDKFESLTKQLSDAKVSVSQQLESQRRTWELKMSRIAKKYDDTMMSMKAECTLKIKEAIKIGKDKKDAIVAKLECDHKVTTEGLEKQLNKAKQQVSANESLIVSLQSSIEQLRSALNNEKNTNAELKTDKDKAESKAVMLEQQLQTHSEQNNHTGSEGGSVSAEAKRIEILTKQLTESENMRGSLSLDNAKLKQAQEELASMKTRLQDRINTLEQHNQQQQQDIKAKQHENTKLKSRVGELDKDNNTLKASIKDFDTNKRNQDKAIANLNDKLKHEEKARSDAVQALQNLQNKQSDASSERQQELQTHLQQANTEKESLGSRVSELSAKLSELEGEKKAHQEQITQFKMLKRVVRKLQKEKDVLTKANQTLKADLETKSSSASELQAQASSHEEDLRQVLQQHKKEKSELEARLTESQSFLKQQLEGIKHRHLVDLQTKEDLIDQLTNTNHRLQSEIEGLRLHSEEQDRQHSKAQNTTNARVEGLKSNHKRMVEAMQHQFDQEKALLESRIQGFHEHRAEAELKVAEYERQMKEAQQELVKAQVSLQECLELKREVSLGEENIRVMKRKHHALQQQMARKERQIEAFKEKLAKAAAAAASATSAASAAAQGGGSAAAATQSSSSSDRHHLTTNGVGGVGGSSKSNHLMAYVQQLQREQHDNKVMIDALRAKLDEAKKEASKYMSTGEMDYLRNVFMKYLEKKDNHGADLLDSICRVLKLDQADVKRIKDAQYGSWIGGMF